MLTEKTTAKLNKKVANLVHLADAASLVAMARNVEAQTNASLQREMLVALAAAALLQAQAIESEADAAEAKLEAQVAAAMASLS